MSLSFKSSLGNASFFKSRLTSATELFLGFERGLDEDLGRRALNARAHFFALLNRFP